MSLAGKVGRAAIAFACVAGTAVVSGLTAFYWGLACGDSYADESTPQAVACDVLTPLILPVVLLPIAVVMMGGYESYAGGRWTALTWSMILAALLILAPLLLVFELPAGAR